MPLHQRASILKYAAAALACWAALACHAGEVRWKGAPFEYTAKGKNLKELLREFGTSQGLLVVVAPEVEGVVNGKFSLAPGSMIELLSAAYGFVWHAEGNVLYISPSSDVRSEVIRMSGTNAEKLRETLERLNILDPRFPILYDDKLKTAMVSGPNRYVDLVVQAARSADLDQGASPTEIRVFPLRFAWAGDIVYGQGSGEQTIPGVVSVLADLYGQSASVLPAATQDRSRGVMPATAMQRLGQRADAAPSSRDMSSRITLATPQIAEGGGLPKFRADSRRNAVVVRDIPERMKSHEAAIRALDVKSGLVEIEVRIIEVNAEAAESLGVDWRLRGSRVDIQMSSTNLPTLNWGTALAQAAPSGVITTLLGDAGNFLIARVNALAQQGKASMRSSPKILTLDNVEAVMENLSTFYVKVSGNLDANLFDVSVGTSLRVTPFIMQDDNDQQLIKLAIRIEDGSVTNQVVDSVPVVRRSSITTQSMIPQGQALLIAGYTQETESSEQTGVPGLASLPWVGGLFRHTSKTERKVERFFLLTPKVVNL